MSQPSIGSTRLALGAIDVPAVVGNLHTLRVVNLLQWNQNCNQRADRHGSGIAGSRGVRFSSPTEPDIDDCCGSKTSKGDGPKAPPAVWDHGGFIGG
jgi:hypothetical protein